MASLKLNGTVIPYVQKIEITRNPIWSSNTGRTASGKMVGDLVTQKYKLKITFSPMSDEDTVSLEAVISQAFFDVTFKNPTTGKMETKKMYADAPVYPVYSYADELPRYVGNAVSLVEQ